VTTFLPLFADPTEKEIKFQEGKCQLGKGKKRIISHLPGENLCFPKKIKRLLTLQ
jgi:hypothetical protein